MSNDQATSGQIQNLASQQETQKNLMLNKKQHKDIFQEIHLGQENSIIQEESQEYDEENRKSVGNSGHKPVECQVDKGFAEEEIQFGIE
jgi:hypothetical protein